MFTSIRGNNAPLTCAYCSDGLVKYHQSIAVSGSLNRWDRYHIITQLAVYTTYISLIYFQLGDYIYHLPPIFREPGNSIFHQPEGTGHPPSSLSGTVIDWFQPWPMDALYNVGAKFLEPIEQLGPQDGCHRSPTSVAFHFGQKGDSLGFLLELSLDAGKCVLFFCLVFWCVFQLLNSKIKLEHPPPPLLKPFWNS